MKANSPYFIDLQPTVYDGTAVTFMAMQESWDHLSDANMSCKLQMRIIVLYDNDKHPTIHVFWYTFHLFMKPRLLLEKLSYFPLKSRL